MLGIGIGEVERQRRHPTPRLHGVKKGSQESETALRPLVDWLHGIEALELPPSDMKSTTCASDD